MIESYDSFPVEIGEEIEEDEQLYIEESGQESFYDDLTYPDEDEEPFILTEDNDNENEQLQGYEAIEIGEEVVEGDEQGIEAIPDPEEQVSSEPEGEPLQFTGQQLTQSVSGSDEDYQNQVLAYLEDVPTTADILALNSKIDNLESSIQILNENIVKLESNMKTLGIMQVTVTFGILGGIFGLCVFNKIRA